MRSMLLALSVLVSFQTALIAQNQTGTVRVQVRAAQKPVADAEVIVAGTTHRTDAAGATTILNISGTIELTVAKAGFAPATASVQVAPGTTQEIIVELQPQPTVEETVTVVASTRTDKRLEDQPMRVEVLAREEIEEKMLMTPGDIVMMLNEMGGMRVQATSPSLGPRAFAFKACAADIPACCPTACLCLVRLAGSDCSRFRRWISDRSRSSKGWRRRCTAPGQWEGSSTCCRGALAPSPNRSSC
jgi:hypothetical protein